MRISYPDGMEFAELEAMLAISDAGSFTAAATALHISQPAISRRIELLERELGCPLFERTRAGARLTEAGLAFLPFASAAIAATRDGAAAAREAASGEVGVITLALVGTLAGSTITERLRAFRASFPAVRLHLRTARSDEVGRLVATAQATLGIRYFADPDPALESIPIMTERLVVVCSGESPLIDHSPLTAADLAGQVWVTYPVDAGSSGEPFTRALEREMARAGIEAGERIAIDSLTAQKRMIEAGFGLGLVPRSSITSEIELGTLAILEVPALQVEIPVMAIRRKRGHHSAAASKLLADLMNP